MRKWRDLARSVQCQGSRHPGDVDLLPFVQTPIYDIAVIRPSDGARLRDRLNTGRLMERNPLPAGFRHLSGMPTPQEVIT